MDKQESKAVAAKGAEGNQFPAEKPEAADSIKVEGNDAVCFTAGLAGAAFGAGVIHAYLAADRDPPAVAAGISLGALNAAAMQRVYQELLKAKPTQSPVTDEAKKGEEAARWRWFRKYVEALADHPLNVFWDAIPDQSDFFADMEPIRDTSVPASLKTRERKARRRRYLLVRLGQWLANLPVKVGRVASLLVHYVRIREKYEFKQKLGSVLALLHSGVVLITQVILHAGLSWQAFPEHRFAPPPKKHPAREPWAIPLPWQFGLRFLSWLNLFNVTVTAAFWVIAFASAFAFKYSSLQEPDEKQIYVGVLVATFSALALLAARTKKGQRWLMDWWLVRKWLLPGFGWMVYLLSWASLWLWARIVYSCSWIAKSYLEWKDIDAGERMLAVSFATLVVPCFFFVLLIAVPELKRWMNRYGFLQQWKRPLFGWGMYLFLCMHLLSLAGYLAFGERLIYVAARQSEQAFDFRLLGRATIELLLIPLVAIALVVLVWLSRNWLEAQGILERNFKPKRAWREFGLLSLLLLYLGGSFFEYLRQAFTSNLGVVVFPRGAEGEFAVSAWGLFATWVLIFGALLLPELRDPVFGHVLERLGLRRGLVYDYNLRRKLMQLFDPHWKKNASEEDPEVVRLEKEPVRVLLVAAPLPTLSEHQEPLSSYQVWARPETPLIDALRTALSSPPFLAPVRLETRQQLAWWLKNTVREEWEKTEQYQKRKGLDLVDGGVIRENPLPALFSYLRNDLAMALRLQGHNDKDHPAIHVVYRVPLEGRPVPPPVKPDPKQKIEKVPKFNIVDVTKLSLRLSARRDTQLEVEQTNTISRMEQAVKDAGGRLGEGKNFSSRIFADEIAPEEDLVFENPLDPNAREILTAVAAGCRGALQILYKDELAAFSCTSPEVHCPALLESIVKPRRKEFLSPAPGLAEVCQHCTEMLKRPKEKKGEEAQHSTLLVADALEGSKKLITSMPWLSGEQPRIVLVASGGVFRGAFHIGMLAALRECRIKPDLIVGASVGTLMGGALAAMFMPPREEPKDGAASENILTQLVNTFLCVDERVALTKRLKGAARELGLRGRGILLSPGDMRQMMKKGGRSDPSLAIVGAPAALIDALSNLFMIPYQQTKEIAAAFVAGHVTEATNLFLQQLKEETLERLDIECAVIGTSLLESVARELLGATDMVLTERQPFKTARIAFYGTTTNLVTQSPMLLGGNRERADAPYDYVEATLASSAFPAVFAPRQESAVFPGSGRADIFFSDGGMFDNLPFLPAIEILSRGQEGYRRTWGKNLTALEFLRKRNKSPDLLIAGALNALPENEAVAAGPFDSLAAIHKRAKSLENNVKIRSFEYAARRIHEQLGRYLAGTVNPHPADTTDIHAADKMVDAAVLPVFPASPEHLNGTFAFCASTGLAAWRVHKSIADGCYQTMLALAEQQTGTGLTAESVRELKAARKIPTIERLPSNSGKKDGVTLGRCPFFKWSYPQQDGPAAPHTCPFVTGGEGTPGWRVYRACGKDSAHAKA